MIITDIGVTGDYQLDRVLKLRYKEQFREGYNIGKLKNKEFLETRLSFDYIKEYKSLHLIPETEEYLLFIAVDHKNKMLLIFMDTEEI